MKSSFLAHASFLVTTSGRTKKPSFLARDSKEWGWEDKFETANDGRCIELRGAFLPSALAASLSDFTILGEEHGQLFLSSPLETPEVQRGEVDAAGLGGATLHASRSGIACLVADDEDDAFYLVQEILSYLPDHNDAIPPYVPTDDPIDRLNNELETLVPDNPNRPYNMVGVVEEVVDDGEFTKLFGQ